MVARQATEVFNRASERERLKNVQYEAFIIVETAIATAMATKKLSEIDPTLKQQLVTEFGNVLISKGNHLNGIRFARAFQPLTPQLSQMLAEAHQGTWAFFSGTSDKLRIDQDNVDNIKQWLNTINLKST